jgi:hypothetical protein
MYNLRITIHNLISTRSPIMQFFYCEYTRRLRQADHCTCILICSMGTDRLGLAEKIAFTNVDDVELL